MTAPTVIPAPTPPGPADELQSSVLAHLDTAIDRLTQLIESLALGTRRPREDAEETGRAMADVRAARAAVVAAGTEAAGLRAERDAAVAERDELRERVQCDSGAGCADLSLIPTVDQFHAQAKRTEEWAREARQAQREARAAEAALAARVRENADLRADARGLADTLGHALDFIAQDALADIAEEDLPPGAFIVRSINVDAGRALLHRVRAALARHPDSPGPSDPRRTSTTEERRDG